jgi:two-component system, chemotaxis family, chemotaxis protein CheY
MNELQAMYRAALPDQVAALEAARAAGGSEADARIRRIAHTLRGSGGTYGFPHISAAAAAVEAAASDELPARLAAFIAVLRSEAAADPYAANRAAQPAQGDGSATAPPYPARRILVVDDDPETRLLVRHVLSGAGHVVIEAADGAAALEAYRAAAVDVVLMDVMLGAEDGVVVAESLLRTNTTPVSLIFLTGVADAAQHARMHAAGAAGVIAKPFDPARLAAEVHQIIAS